MAPVKHGHAPYGRPPSRTYRSWATMIQRCHNPNNPRYDRYGGRGIKVCDRWRYSFVSFLADMGIRPVGRTLDRANGDGHYEPGNCQWSDNMTQGGNTIRVRKITAFGKTQSLRRWAIEYKISMGALAQRLDAGLAPELALTLKRWDRPAALKKASGFVGAKYAPHHKTKPWRSSIQHNKRAYHLGFFATPKEAHVAWGYYTSRTSPESCTEG